MQSGGSTAVMNRSLAAIVGEVRETGAFGEVYGAERALDGLLAGNLVDLGRYSKSWWQRAARTPGAVLGSSRRKLADEDVPVALANLIRWRVGFLFIIGGNDSAETGHRISLESRSNGWDLTVVNVPKTIDNDLVMTDHSPGYGSAARFVAMATMGAGRDNETMGRESPVSILELMGRDAGWLAASSALGKREERDAPHVICLPEVPVDESSFLDLIEGVCARFGFAVAVVAENARGPEGVLGGGRDPWYVDAFGHPYFEGAGRYLASVAAKRLGVRVRYERPGTIQRSMVNCVSSTDVREAEMAGRAAVGYARKKQADGRMVTLLREPGPSYVCSTGLAPLKEVAGRVKKMPERFLDPAHSMVTQEFIDFAGPLIGSRLPRFARLG